MKIALAGLVLILVLGVGLGFVAKRSIESDAFQEALREQIETSLGASSEGAAVEWTTAEAPLFSPSLNLVQPVLRLGDASGDRRASSLVVAAEFGEADLDLRSLLAGRVELRSLRLSRGELEVHRAWRSGELFWRVEDLELVSERVPRSAAEPSRFAIRASGTRPVEARDTLRLSADGVVTTHSDGPLALSASFDFGPQGEVELRVTRAAPLSGSEATADPGLELVLALERVDLGMLPVWTPKASFDVNGFATGSLKFFRAATTPERIETDGSARDADRIEIDVRLKDAELRMPEYTVDGIIPAQVSIEAPFSERPSGRIELDLTHARFDFRGRFEKPAGQGATVTTIFRPGVDDGIEFENHVSLRDLHQILSIDGSARSAD